MLNSNKKSVVVLIFSFISIALSIFNYVFKGYFYESIFLNLFSSILLVVYVIAPNKPKFSFVFPTIYAFYVIFYIIKIVDIVEIFNAVDDHRLIGIGYIYIVFSLLFIITAINTFSTKVKKLFPIISVSMSLAVFVALDNVYPTVIKFIIMLVIYRGDRFDEFAIFGTHVLAHIASHIALIVFICKNKIPSVLLNFSNMRTNISTKQALNILNARLEFGVISSEEYQRQRKEIIDKL